MTEVTLKLVILIALILTSMRTSSNCHIELFCSDNFSLYSTAQQKQNTSLQSNNINADNITGIGELKANKTVLIISQTFIFSVFFLTAMYWFIFWLVIRKDSSNLYFSIFCTVNLLNELLINGYIFSELTWKLPLVITNRMEFALQYVPLPLLHLLVSSVYSKNFPKYIANATYLVMFIIVVNSLFLQPLQISYFLVYLYAIALVLHIIYWVCFIPENREKEGTLYFLLGFVIYIVSAIFNNSSKIEIIRIPFLSEFAVLLSVILLSWMLTKRSLGTIIELDQLRKTLEQQVTIRTEQLAKARDKAIKVSEENRLLSRNITAVLEEERKAIASEIHDSFNATLIGIKFHLQAIKALSTTREIDEIVTSLSSIVSEKYDSARSLVRRLRPEAIDTLGLGSAIKNLISSLNGVTSGCIFTCEISDNLKDLNEKASIAIYRIIQEATTNILKYAEASQATITVMRSDDIELEIKDNGIGFDPETTVEGIGLISMRERALDLGGSFTVDSSPGSGTRLIISIPDIISE